MSEKSTQEKEVALVASQAGSIEEKANEIVITDDASRDAAITFVTEIRTQFDRGEKVRKFFVDPLNEQVKKINNLFKPPLDRIKGAEGIVRRKLTEYQMEQERKAEEARQAVAKQVRDKKIGVEKAVQKIEAIKEPEKTIRSEERTVSFAEKKKVVIEDATKLPREYLMPDEMKIKKVALAGIEIPGVKVIIEKVPVIKNNF